MAASSLPQKVADAFVELYYPILKQYPEQTYKFYKESSLLGWEGSDGLVTPVTTLNGIKEKIMSSDFRNCSVEIVNIDSQQSLGGGFIVVVSGLSTWSDNVKKEFNQTFFLVKQEKALFVLNDILRFSNECELRTSSVANDGNKQDQAAFSAPNAVAAIVSDSHAVNHESASKNKDIKQGLDLSVVKHTDSKASTSKPSPPSHDKAAPLVVEPFSAAKVDPKISYASMVVKVTPLTNAGYQVIPPSINKASSTPRNVARKASIPSNAVPKSSVSVNDIPNTHSRVKKIYVGDLPHDITKRRFAEVMKKFGPIGRGSDSIQITCCEDGFRYGLVEFESVDTALRAVEAQNVQFGDKRAYIKGSSSRGGNGYDNGKVGNKQRPQSGNRPGYNNGQVRDRPRQNR